MGRKKPKRQTPKKSFAQERPPTKEVTRKLASVPGPITDEELFHPPNPLVEKQINEALQLQMELRRFIWDTEQPLPTMQQIEEVALNLNGVQARLDHLRKNDCHPRLQIVIEAYVNIASTFVRSGKKIVAASEMLQDNLSLKQKKLDFEIEVYMQNQKAKLDKRLRNPKGA